MQINNNKMENTNVTVNFLLDTRRSKKDKKYPLKITIYFEGYKKRYNTGIDLTEDDWEKLNGSKLRDDSLKMIKRKIEVKRKKAEDIVEKMELFSFRDFQIQYLGQPKSQKSTSITYLFNEYMDQLEKEERIGTKDSYETTLSSLLKFKGNIRITEISTSYLMEYEKYMTQNGKSPSTIGIYLRQLRRIINVAINTGIFPPQKYPFKGYSIPSSRNIKKSLTSVELKSLFNYQTENKRIRRALDFWLFSYLCNGMNMADICYLKITDIHGDFFSFFRAKTIKTVFNAQTKNGIYFYEISRRGTNCPKKEYQKEYSSYTMFN